MSRLHTRVNLIPVIAKADTMTDEEIADFKTRVSLPHVGFVARVLKFQQVLADIALHKIHIFQAPTYENEDEESLAEAEEIASKIPFAVVGSDKIVTTPDGRKVRGRVYPWGIVEVDNEEHCDFVKLRQMLIRTYMEELREYTNDVLYENWRTERLLSRGVVQDPTVFKEVNPAVRNHEERVMHEAKLAKMEVEMKMVFQQKVAEKEAKLKQSEEELYARHKEMKEALDKQRADLEEKRRRIESGRPLTPEGKSSVGPLTLFTDLWLTNCSRLGERRASFEPNPSALRWMLLVRIICFFGGRPVYSPPPSHLSFSFIYRTFVSRSAPTFQATRLVGLFSYFSHFFRSSLWLFFLCSFYWSANVAVNDLSSSLPVSRLSPMPQRTHFDTRLTW
jgi:hypothetical protein